MRKSEKKEDSGVYITVNGKREEKCNLEAVLKFRDWDF